MHIELHQTLFILPIPLLHITHIHIASTYALTVSSANKEAIWLSCLVGDLGVHQVPMLHCDSQSAIDLAKNLVFHSKSKHIKVRYHVIWDILASKRLDIVKVHTNDNPIDALTKILSLEWFAHYIELMGVG